MCATCGCSDDDHDHHHHPHDGHTHDGGREIAIEQAVLAKNDAVARHNRAWMADRGIIAVNLMSSPGAGKTTLLERTIRTLGGAMALSVIEGDQASDRDAARIRATGVPVVQVNTGTGCHLDAEMVAKALRLLDPAPRSLVFVENVGNLVCPALFDLGERARVVVTSVTEGEDKPLKYPHMFRRAGVVVLNKTDLLPHVDFDASAWCDNVLRVNPKLVVLSTSARYFDGIGAWLDWVQEAAT